MPRRLTLIAFAVAVTIASTVVALRGTHPREIADAIRGSDPLWLVPSLLALALGVLLRALRWRALFAPGRRPGVWPVTAATVVGYFFNSILPLRAGEAARLVALNQRGGIPRVEIGGTVVIERVYDLVALFVLLFVLLPWLPEVAWLRAAAAFGAIVLVLVLAAVAALAVWGDAAVHRLVRPLGRLRFVPAERLDGIGESLAQGLVGLRRARLAAAAFALTLLSWAVLGVSAWFVLVSFDLGLTPAAGIFVMIALGLSAVLPAGPSGVGVFEAAAVVALGAFGVDDSRALSAAVVLHAVNFVPFVVAGLALLRFHVVATARAVEESRAAAEK